jgi:hypothetical protein
MTTEYDPERDGVLLKAGEVMALLHVARSTLPLMRKRGELTGYKGSGGHWKYPSNQRTLREARAALQGAGGSA